MKNYVLGADPGKKGAIVLLATSFDSKNIQEDDIIFITFKLLDDRRIDINDLYSKLKPYKKNIKFCIIEHVHAIFGSSAASTFEFGDAFGTLRTCLQLVTSPAQVVLLPPKFWQKYVWKNNYIVYKNNNGRIQKDTKATSLKAAFELFPNVSFVLKRCRKPHDGLVDAALIAYCALLKYREASGI